MLYEQVQLAPSPDFFHRSDGGSYSQPSVSSWANVAEVPHHRSAGRILGLRFGPWRRRRGLLFGPSVMGGVVVMSERGFAPVRIVGLAGMIEPGECRSRGEVPPRPAFSIEGKVVFTFLFG